MGILRINQLPSGTSLTEDDLLIILDDPSGIAVTKQIPSSRIRDLIYDENGKLTNAQLPDTIQARLCVLNDTDAVLSQQLLFSGELAAPTDRSYLRKGDGATIGGQIIANGNSYIENNINQPIVSLQTLAGSGAYFTDSFTVTPSQKIYFQVGNSGDYLSYDGLWTSKGFASFPGSASVTSMTINSVVGGTLTFPSYENLTAIYCPSYKFATEFRLFVNISTLNLIDLPQLEGANSLIFIGNSITTLNIPLLKYANSINMTQMTNFVNLNIPLLKYVGGFVIGGSFGTNMNSLVTLNAPSLEFLGSLTTGGGSPAALTSLTTINFPALKILNGAISITSTVTGANVTNFTFGSGLLHVGGNITITGQKLTSASVENILVRLAALDGTNGTIVFGSGRTINLSGGTSVGQSALTTAANNARTTLVNRGVSVTLNA
jgi:hypothetical protein